MQSKRLQESLKEVAFTDKNIQEISYDLGYNDDAYFNRVFKNSVGQTPKQFRENFDFKNTYRLRSSPRLFGGGFLLGELAGAGRTSEEANWMLIARPSSGTPLYCFIALTASDFRSNVTSAVPRDRPERS